MRAMVKFSAAARISRPKRVRFRKVVRASRIMMVTAMVMTCRGGMRAPKISTCWVRFDHRSMDLGRLE